MPRNAGLLVLNRSNCVEHYINVDLDGAYVYVGVWGCVCVCLRIRCSCRRGYLLLSAMTGCFDKGRDCFMSESRST